MENRKKNTSEVNKVTDTLAKELESLSSEGLREFFMYFIE